MEKLVIEARDLRPDAFRELLVKNRDFYLDHLQQGGVLFFSETPCRDEKQFRQSAEILNPDLKEYTGAKVRREEADPFVYAPTSTPRHRINYLHHEMGYQPDIPEGLALFCVKPAPEGGDSLLADSRDWYREIPEEVRREVEEQGLLVQRLLVHRNPLQKFIAANFDFASILPSWQGNFATEDKAVAKKMAEALGYDVSWFKEKHMLLKAKISPIGIHPVGREKMWVNNAHLFQLHPMVFGNFQYRLYKLFFKLSRMPMTTIQLGEGRPFPQHFTEEILKASLRAHKTFKLKSGDMVFLNNRCISHGRLPFAGPRRLVFAMYHRLKGATP